MLFFPLIYVKMPTNFGTIVNILTFMSGKMTIVGIIVDILTFMSGKMTSVGTIVGILTFMSGKKENFPAHNCWHFKTYEQEKLHAQLS